MAKFTVYFKDKAIHAGVFETGVVHIGRDETCDLVVDSLAVAPAHAVVVVKENSCFIKQMNDKFPLLINNRPMKECNLQDNDVINIGKHYIVYNIAGSLATPDGFTKNLAIDALSDKPMETARVQDANLQVMEGDHIGRILPLKKAMTRLGHEKSGVVVVARRKEGYFISALLENDGLMVNSEPLANKTLKLSNRDVIVIDKIPMQFFLD